MILTVFVEKEGKLVKMLLSEVVLAAANDIRATIESSPGLDPYAGPVRTTVPWKNMNELMSAAYTLHLLEREAGLTEVEI
jgi:hypothetical protein